MFTIDSEFQKLIPQLAAEERTHLEANIIADGCREPLTAWKEEGLLLDGHNRFSICAANRLPYDVVQISLPSRQHAINWIINNQLGRRNVTGEQASYLRGKRYNMEKVTEPFKGNQHTSGGDQFDPHPKTADRLANEFKVSAPTIKRDGKFAEAVDSLGDEARTAVLSGDSKLAKRDVVDAAEWYKQDAVANTHFVPAKPIDVDEYVAAGDDLVADVEAYDWTEEETSPVSPLTEKEILEAANKIRARKTEKRRGERKARNEEMCSEPPALADLPHRFDLVYADPPWRYEFNQTDSRVIENQYPTMDLDDICAMPVNDITIKNSVLFLWATFPKLEEAMRVVNAWGFTYRTAIVWDKVRMGQGIYTRQQTELLLIAIKGEMYRPESNYAGNFRSLVSIERSQNHSEKPKEFYDIIEGLYPDCTKIELFARNERAGWTVWGNQA